MKNGLPGLIPVRIRWREPNKKIMKNIATILVLLSFCLVCHAEEKCSDIMGWNSRPVPKRIAVCAQTSDFGERMLVSSLSGLAAQSVADGKSDEMVWAEVPVQSYKTLFDSAMSALSPEIRYTDAWSLLKDYKASGIVKGYVLYKEDRSEGRVFSKRSDADLSANVATAYAGALKAVLVEESQEKAARKLGLKRLKDCRSISPEQCFEDLKGILNNHGVVSMDPKSHNCRDYAIANRLMVYFGVNDFAEKVLEWVEPLSPVIGWNCGEEFYHTAMVSKWGHFNTASDRCENMNVLAAASAVMTPSTIQETCPEDIDFTKGGPYHSYLLTDGDNMQWANSSFLTSEAFYSYGSKQDFGMNWTSCPCNLSVMSVPAWNIIASGKPQSNSIVEYGGGYYYPDLFAINRDNRKELLEEFSFRVGRRMESLGIKLFGIICKDVDSPASKEYFSIFAKNIPGLAAIVAVQYYPYELDTEPMWFEGRDGADVPVLSAKYSIWDAVDANRPNAGTPEFVAEMVNRHAIAAERSGKDSELSFTIVHAWSVFNGNNSSNKEEQVQGASSAHKSSKLLLEGIKTVSLNELIWRIRMKYRPEQTKNIIDSNL